MIGDARRITLVEVVEAEEMLSVDIDGDCRRRFGQPIRSFVPCDIRMAADPPDFKPTHSFEGTVVLSGPPSKGTVGTGAPALNDHINVIGGVTEDNNPGAEGPCSGLKRSGNLEEGPT